MAVMRLRERSRTEEINAETIAEYLLAHPEIQEEANKHQNSSNAATDASDGKNDKVAKSRKR